jgi:hypothetical protein
MVPKQTRLAKGVAPRSRCACHWELRAAKPAQQARVHDRPRTILITDLVCGPFVDADHVRAVLPTGRPHPRASQAPMPPASHPGAQREEAGASAATAQLPAWLLALDSAPAEPAAPGAASVPLGFMLGWGTISAMALGSGAMVGYRSFEGSAAYEALDKLEKPTPSSEAQASRMAVRAFGWGTALAFGSAALAVLAVRAMGVHTAADVGTSVRAALGPVDAWLRSFGDRLHGIANTSQTALDGVGDSVSERWQGSSLGGAVRQRMERGTTDDAGAAAGEAQDSAT